VIAAFFYIRVMVLMYMQEPVVDHEPDDSPMPLAALAIPAALTLVLGVLPGLVTDLLRDAAVIRW
jgi:NADH-quinone oxidoreductase subunit N